MGWNANRHMQGKRFHTLTQSPTSHPIKRPPRVLYFFAPGKVLVIDSKLINLYLSLGLSPFKVSPSPKVLTFALSFILLRQTSD